MNRKRVEHAAAMLKDLGLAAVIGGTGDLVVNTESGRNAVDVWGVACGFFMLMVSLYLAGVDPLRRRS